jgi:hypothetical protein
MVRRNCLVAALLITIGSRLPAAWGQDDWDVPKKPVDQMVQQNQFNLPDFDQWVLQGRSRDQVESTTKSLLSLQVESVARACELSLVQREKLQLAGEYDMKRMWRGVDELRVKFHQAQPLDQQKYSELINAGSTMQRKLQSGTYDDFALLQKVLGQTLNHEQSLRYEQQERQRRRFQYEAKLNLILLNLEGTVLLTADQRQKLVNLLVSTTDPPKKFGQYDQYFVFYQLGKLDESKLKPILDDAQRKSLRSIAERYRGMEPTLRAQGYFQ